MNLTPTPFIYMKSLFKEELNAKFKAFSKMSSIEDLSHILEIKKNILVYYTYIIPENKKYVIFEIAKQNGKKREIQAPIYEIKLLQQKILVLLRLTYIPKHCVHGYVKGRSVLSNAKSHIGKPYLLNLDLEVFFKSIHFGRILGLFQSPPFNFPDKISAYLAQLCSFSGFLPQGAPTSPIIANMIAYSLDKSLMEIAKDNKFNYTRYSDDLTFSTMDRKIGTELMNSDSDLRKLISKTIRDSGFRVNRTKIRCADKFDHQEVTGIVVNKKANIRRRYYRNIRAMLHAWEKYGYQKAENEFKTKYDKRNRLRTEYKKGPIFINVIKGKIEWLKMVRGPDALYNKLAGNFAKLIDRDKKLIESNIMHDAIAPSFKRDVFYENSVLVLRAGKDLMNNFYEGTAFFIGTKTLLTCAHCVTDLDTSQIHPNIVLFKGTEPANWFKAKVISYNFDCDLALLILDENVSGTFNKLPTCLNWKFEHGQMLKVYGYPHFFQGRGLRIEECKVVAERKYVINLVEVSAGIFSGNSGGPVLNDQGLVVGVAKTGVDEPKKKDEISAHCIIPLHYKRELKPFPEV